MAAQLQAATYSVSSVSSGHYKYVRIPASPNAPMEELRGSGGSSLESDTLTHSLKSYFSSSTPAADAASHLANVKTHAGAKDIESIDPEIVAVARSAEDGRRCTTRPFIAGTHSVARCSRSSS